MPGGQQIRCSPALTRSFPTCLHIVLPVEQCRRLPGAFPIVPTTMKCPAVGISWRAGVKSSIRQVSTKDTSFIIVSNPRPRAKSHRSVLVPAPKTF